MPCRNDLGPSLAETLLPQVNKLTSMLCLATDMLFSEECHPDESEVAVLRDWWREHKEADAKRTAARLAERNKAALKARLLRELTPEEKDALGIKG